MDESELKALASQLSCPEGEMGVEVGHKMNEINQFITRCAIEALAPQASDVIAEFGPGNGALSDGLLDTLGKDGKYYGIEFSEVMASAARQRFEDKACEVDIICGDCMQVKMPEKHLDAAMAVNFLYFIDDLDGYFSHVTKWMKPGARAVYGIRSEKSLSAMPFVEYGFNVRSVDEIKESMRNNGFSDVSSSYYDEGVVNLGELSLPFDSVIIKGVI